LASEVEGSGLGLFAAKTLVEGNFGGSIRVSQGEFSYELGGKSWWRTTFGISVPRSNGVASQRQHGWVTAKYQTRLRTQSRLKSMSEAHNLLWRERVLANLETQDTRH
jgi:hypothetical protein